MTSYQQFPRGGVQQHMTGGGGNGQPAAFIPYANTGGGLGVGAGGGGGGYAEAHQAHQRSPSGGGGGMIPVRMADGTQGFAPAQQMQGGGQWGYGQGGQVSPGIVSNGSSPGGMGLGGMSLLQQQMTGYNAQQVSVISTLDHDDCPPTPFLFPLLFSHTVPRSTSKLTYKLSEHPREARRRKNGRENNAPVKKR